MAKTLYTDLVLDTLKSKEYLATDANGKIIVGTGNFGAINILTSGTLGAGVGTLTSLNLKADSNQIVLDSDGTYTTTLTDSAATSSKTITFPNITGTLATTTVAGGGTGAASFTAYSLVTGNTTTTGALTSIANNSTSYKPLMSKGTSSYPAWSSTIYPDTITQYNIPYSTVANTISSSSNFQYNGTALIITSTTVNKLKLAYSASQYYEIGVESDGDLVIDSYDSNTTGDIYLKPKVTAGAALSLLSDSGKITLGGYGLTNNESLTFDFETTANRIGVSSPSSATAVDFGSLIIDAGGYEANGTAGIDDTFDIDVGGTTYTLTFTKGLLTAREELV